MFKEVIKSFDITVNCLDLDRSLSTCHKGNSFSDIESSGDFNRLLKNCGYIKIS